jgi:hypothetical protein
MNRQTRFSEQCQAHGLTLAASEVYVLARWITSRDLPKRFDVPFLVARMPEGQTPVADETEQFEPVWVRPGDALARHQTGTFFMIFPTIRTLQRLQAFANVDAVLQACAMSEDPLWSSCPRAKCDSWNMSPLLANWRWSARMDRSCTRWIGNLTAPYRCSKTCCV